MRSLKNLKENKKNLVNRNTGNINLPYNPMDNNITAGIITNSGIVFRNLPNSPIGLTDGSVWRDENGFLRIV